MSNTDERPAVFRKIGQRIVEMLKTGFQLLVVGLLAVMAIVPAKFAEAQTAPKQAAAPNAASNKTQKGAFESMPSVVAEINGTKITKEELAFEALKMHGRDEVDEMIGLSIVLQECKRLNITVTDEEVRAEIERFAARFNLPVDKWLELVRNENGLSYEQHFAKTKQRVGLRKIAGQSVQVTNEEINRKLDAMYGPGIQVRQIVLFDKAKADAVFQQLQANPTKENFVSLAKQMSDDQVSASMGGLIPAIRRYSMPDNVQLENLLMNLKEGEITNLVQMSGVYIIFRHEKAVPSVNVDRQALVEKTYYMVEEEKINKAASQIMPALVQRTQITKNFFETPQAQNASQIPAIVATINGEPIYSKTVAEICAMRYGAEVLQGMIIQRIIDQKCKEMNIVVTQEEITAELGRVASSMFPNLQNGQPDIQRLVEMQCREMKIDPTVYYTNVIRPMLVLKKLAAPAVNVTLEDREKAFQATYGPRVEVLAIFLDKQRDAHDVWSQARRACDPSKPIELSKQAFGKLAAQYSIEETTRINEGFIEPVSRYCGMPQVEEVAFTLKPGEISEVIPFDTINGKQYVILLCLGMTEPRFVSPDEDEIRDTLYAHIYDQKLEIEVGQVLNRIISSATIDNYLTGKTQGPSTANAPTGSTIR